MQVKDRAARNPIGYLPDQRCHNVDIGRLTSRRLGARKGEFGYFVAVQEVGTPGGHSPIVPGRST
jgi:hypothetical protein